MPPTVLFSDGMSVPRARTLALLVLLVALVVAPALAQDGFRLSYDVDQARLVLRQDGERHEIAIRAQAHRLVRYMVERNEASGGAPALCTHDELMEAVR